MENNGRHYTVTEQFAVKHILASAESKPLGVRIASMRLFLAGNLILAQYGASGYCDFGAAVC
jgi:hypothetical protein